MDSAPEQLQVHDVVRVASVADLVSWVAGEVTVARPPRVADEGRVVASDAGGLRVVVEMCHPSGHKIWQATFASADLQLISRASR